MYVAAVFLCKSCVQFWYLNPTSLPETPLFNSSFQVVIVKLKMDKDRKRILDRKARARQTTDKGKHTEESIMET